MKQSRMFAAVAALAAGLAGCQGADEPNADASPREELTLPVSPNAAMVGMVDQAAD